jgi:hypothetical protein
MRYNPRIVPSRRGYEFEHMNESFIPTSAVMRTIEGLIQEYRGTVTEYLEPLVQEYYPALIKNTQNEYSKMIELSTKMTVVGHACSLVAGHPFDERKQMISTLYGGCCFLADSFVDDFGLDATKEYLSRFDILLTRGWFSVLNDREQLFYVIISRLFYRRDILDPMLRQAIMWLYLAQRRDVELRYETSEFHRMSRRQQLRLLEECASNRSGHAITLLASFLNPDISLHLRGLLFSAGALIMHIDDHGDCFADLYHDRITYMNQIIQPERILKRVYCHTVGRIFEGLEPGEGRDFLIGFLYRYYVTRMRKHELEKHRARDSWVVYE